eukprot:763388-Hanusia_phi.AAC.5
MQLVVGGSRGVVAQHPPNQTLGDAAADPVPGDVCDKVVNDDELALDDPNPLPHGEVQVSVLMPRELHTKHPDPTPVVVREGRRVHHNDPVHPVAANHGLPSVLDVVETENVPRVQAPV